MALKKSDKTKQILKDAFEKQKQKKKETEYANNYVKWQLDNMKEKAMRQRWKDAGTELSGKEINEVTRKRMKKSNDPRPL